MSVAQLAQSLAGALDPAATASSYGITPEPWQQRALRSDSQSQLWLCARQCGKSTTASIKATRQAVYVPGSLTILVSKAQRQSDEVLAKIKAVYRGLGRPLGPPTVDNAGELLLENGSRVLSLPATEGTTRGFSAVDLLVFDEASRIPDDIFVALLPMLRLGGQVLALSTPQARTGWFYDAWVGDGEGLAWERHKITAAESGQYPPERLERMRRAMSSRAFRSEYQCEFVGVQDMVFDPDDVDASVVRVPPLFGGAA